MQTYSAKKYNFKNMLMKSICANGKNQLAAAFQDLCETS